MKSFNRLNCTSTLREQANCSMGGTILLFGTHSKEWSTMWIFNGVIKMITYPNRIAARKEFKKLAI